MHLQEVRVLDLSQSYAASLCAMHLADLGASLLRLPPRPRPLDFSTRHGAIGPQLPSSERASLIASLCAEIDVVLCDDPSPPSLPPHPHLVIAHMPCLLPQHQEDLPQLRTPLAPGLLDAYMGLNAPPLARRPSAHPLSLLDVACGASLTNAILAALYARASHGHGDLVTLSRQRQAYTLLELNALFSPMRPPAYDAHPAPGLCLPPRQWPSLQWAATPFISSYPTQNEGEFIYLHAGLSHHLERLLHTLRPLEPALTQRLERALSPATRRSPTSVPTLSETARLRRVLTALFSRRTAEDWERLLSEAGLCVVMCRSWAQWCDHPQPREEGQLVRWQEPVSGELRDTTGPLVRSDRHPPRAPAPPRQLLTAQEALAFFSPREAPPCPLPLAQDERGTPPLHDVRVLDLTHVIAGPMAARQLAELGAEVRRVENPHFEAPWVAPFHLLYNAGKSSETLDLKEESGRERFDELLSEFSPDVVTLNLRPGAGGQSGLDEEALRQKLPSLIYARLTAYGERGEWGAYPGWEQTAQAACGIQTGWGADAGRPELFPLPLNDVCTGLHGAMGVLAALYARRREASRGEASRGERVGGSLSGTALLMQARAHWHPSSRGVPQGQRSLGVHPLERFYQARDGWMVLWASCTEALWQVEGLERLQGVGSELILELSLEAELAQHTVSEWQRRIVASGMGEEVQVMPFRTQREVFEDVAAWRSGALVRRAHEGLGEVVEAGVPLRFSRQELAPHLSLAPPRGGEARARRGALREALGWAVAQARGGMGVALSRK